MWKLRKISQFKKEMRSIVLDPAKKSEVKNNIATYIKMHSVREFESPRLKLQKRENILFFNPQHMYAKIATLLILLSGSGTAFAAENTIPGDSLYPVKVHINEPVRAALAVGAEAKANWASAVAERRLDEASRLAAKGTLTTSTEANLEARFTAQTEKVKDQIAQLQAAGKTEVASNLSTRLESAIQIHSQILDKINSEEEEDSTKKQNIKPLIQQLKIDVKSMHDIKVKLDDDVKTRLGPDVKIAAQNHMNLAVKQIENAKNLVSEKHLATTSSAQLKLNEAQKVFDAGKSQLDAGNYMASFISFGSAQRLAAEAKVMTHVETDLKIDDRVHKIFEHINDKGVNLNDTQKVQLEDALKEKIEGKIKTKVENNFEKRIEDFKENRQNIKLNTTNTVRLENDEDKDDDIKIL